MQKFITLFTDSSREFGKVSTITTAAMFGAISVILGAMTLVVSDSLKIGFSTIPSEFVYHLFGPAVGFFYGAAMDILKYIVKPTGAFFPLFTLREALVGVIYGLMFYKRKLTVVRVAAAELLVIVICNIVISTYGLSILLGKGFWFLLPTRVTKNLVMWPINTALFYFIARIMEASGVMNVLRNPPRIGAGRKMENLK